ncbi:MAG: hypothetical protein IT560_09830 [Alphaproteobacteria bacterium]|jgi:hypothetical protein|nr:hypothetical protein [Alphaproteobacteria bacterium]
MANHPHIGHLLQVGKSKAMGLLTLHEIAALGHDGATLAGQFNAKAGYIVRHFNIGDSMWGDPVAAGMESLAVIHLPSLQKLIDGEKELLQRLGWPQTAQEFAKRSFEDYILRDNANPDHSRLQALIKRAYDHPYTGEKKTPIRDWFRI